MRNGKILNKKFFQFLLPTALSVMAMSLNEFVDSLLVANLIDVDAMTLVNMGSPLMLKRNAHCPAAISGGFRERFVLCID